VARFRKLLKAALVVPVNPSWSPEALGAGTIVELMDVKPDAPPRAMASDILIRWQDAAARQVLGWLWERTPLRTSGGPLTRKSWEMGETLGVVDWAREVMTQPGQDPLTWLCREGVKQLDLVKRVIRELGGRLEPREGKFNVIRRAIRLILNKEVSVEEVKEAGRTRKTSAKHRVKDKVNRRAESASQANGERGQRRWASQLPALMKGTSSAGLAKRLAAGEELSKKQLTTLREGINECSSELREKKQDKSAEVLSNANRLVRRLIRSR
jgi:hypothetical protein